MTALIARCRPNFSANSLPNMLAGMARREKTTLTTMGVNRCRFRPCDKASHSPVRAGKLQVVVDRQMNIRTIQEAPDFIG